MSNGDGQPKVQEFTLLEDQELRFEVATKEVVVELVEGTAEVYGSELVQHKKYTFSAVSRVAIFTWHGCKIELVGQTEGAYVAKQTPMVIYLNTHAALEQMRVQAEKDNTRGPRIMIVGPMDVGKSTYCRILLNYAVRMGRCPTYVDLDVGQGSVSLPGSIGALYIEKPADPVESFDRKAPLVYHFGHLSPAENIPFYNIIVQKLAGVVQERCNLSKTANAGGVIINTCGWVKGEGYGCIVKAAEAFEVDVVVVLDHERLYNEMHRDLPGNVKILHQPKSGGVEERSRDTRLALRRARVRQYFYGHELTPLFPHSFHVRFDEVQIFKIGAPNLPDALLPVGVVAEDSRTKLVRVQAGHHLLHHILALSLCESANENFMDTNVAGFVCVTDVSVEKQTLTVLCPQPYPLPRRFLLYSEVTFVDEST